VIAASNLSDIYRSRLTSQGHSSWIYRVGELANKHAPASSLHELHPCVDEGCWNFDLKIIRNMIAVCRIGEDIPINRT